MLKFDAPSDNPYEIGAYITSKQSANGINGTVITYYFLFVQFYSIIIIIIIIFFLLWYFFRRSGSYSYNICDMILWLCL